MKDSIVATRKIKGADTLLEVSSLKRLNILFGKNGTGKSSFLRNLYAQFIDDFHLIVPERGGAEMKYSSGTFDEENVENKKKCVFRSC